jgi:hypothetical protein
MNTVLDEALGLQAAGYCVVPIRLDGTKAPDLKTWKQYKELRPDESELKDWFSKKPAPGLGIIGGYPSSGAECLDFDNHKGNGGVFRQWCDAIPVEILRKMVLYQTPGDGWRAAYRCGTYLDGAKETLAKRSKDDTLIELLGAQVVVVPGGNPAAHPTGRPYSYLRGHLAEVNTITADERGVLLDLAKRFNTYHEPSHERKHYLDLDADDIPKVKSDWFASDDYNLRAEWQDILEPHGWTYAGCAGAVEFWMRPGKYQGVSATTNHLGLGLLHVFTSSTEFEADRSYSKFGAYAILNHGGDCSQASKELARRGYGRANDDTSSLYEKIERLFLK